MRFVLDGKTYDVDAVSRLSLMDVLRFNRESQQGDWGITWAQVEGLIGDLEGLTDEQRRAHPGSVWLLALTIWRARREAGEHLSFEDAVDGVPVFDASRLRFLPDPADRKPKKEKPGDPQRARPGSGRAVAG